VGYFGHLGEQENIVKRLCHPRGFPNACTSVFSLVKVDGLNFCLEHLVNACMTALIEREKVDNIAKVAHNCISAEISPELLF
jgi:hypothetical protein